MRQASRYGERDEGKGIQVRTELRVQSSEKANDGVGVARGFPSQARPPLPGYSKNQCLMYRGAWAGSGKRVHRVEMTKYLHGFGKIIDYGSFISFVEYCPHLEVCHGTAH